MTLQDEIIELLHVKKTIDPKEEAEHIVQFMMDYVKAYPFIKCFVLGISGGQDSTLLGKLAQQAAELLRNEGYTVQFIAVRLPYGEQNDAEDAIDAINFIQPDQTFTVNIKPSVDATYQSLEDANVEISDFTKGNDKARERMKVQYAIAAQHNGIVLGTDHAAENVTGFFTKFGDGAADIIPLFGLNKRQGRQILQYLDAPYHLSHKMPVADLEEERPMISDEEALGVTYDEIDDYLEGKEINPSARETIEKWYKKTEHKRVLPYHRFHLPEQMQ